MLNHAEAERLDDFLSHLDQETAEEVRYFVSRASEPSDELDDYDRFERLCDIGARNYGGAWLVAQRTAIATLRGFGMAPERHRALGAAIALQIASAATKQVGSLTATLRLTEEERNLIVNRRATRATSGLGSC